MSKNLTIGKPLPKIKEEDIIFMNIPFEDRINTELNLADTDWMTYTLKFNFMTPKYGHMDITTEFSGGVTSFMYVDVNYYGKVTHYEYEFSSDIFEKYLMKFMTEHMMQWASHEAFYGGEIVLDLYNTIVEQGTFNGYSDVPDEE